MNDKMFSSLAENKKIFDKNFENSADYFFKPISVMGCSCRIVMCEDLTDSLKLWEVFLRPLNGLSDKRDAKQVYDYIKNNNLYEVNDNV